MSKKKRVSVKMTVPFDEAIFTCKNMTSIQLVLGFCHVSLVCNAKMKFIVQTFTIDNVLIACRQRGAQRVLPAEPDGYFSRLGDQ